MLFSEGTSSAPNIVPELYSNNSTKRTFKKLDMSELFLNITSEKYNCVLRKDSFILALEPENETVVDKREVMNQHVSSLKDLIRSVQSQATNHIQSKRNALEGGSKKNQKASPKVKEVSDVSDNPTTLNTTLTNNITTNNDTQSKNSKVLY